MLNIMTVSRGLILIALALVPAIAQQSTDTGPVSDAPAPPERWNLYYQATSIGQYHGTFRSPYAGRTAFRITRNTTCPSRPRCSSAYGWTRIRSSTSILKLRADRGLSNVNGIADSSNGEMPRVA